VTELDVALYAALATVAAVTLALQSSAVFALVPDADRLATRHEAAVPGTQSYNDLLKDAKAFRLRILIMSGPLASVNLAVLAAWAKVVFCRVDSDWVLTTPWIAVVIAWACLVALPAWLHVQSPRK
jgi:hypothetical protein